MQAAVLLSQNKALVLADLDLPEELAYGQVKVQVHFASISVSQLTEIAETSSSDRALPCLLGHEGAGIVQAVGSGVTYVAPGDHVVMHSFKSQGIDSAPTEYKWGEKTVHAGCLTTLSEIAIVSENRLTVIPKNFDLSLAPLLAHAVTSGVSIVTRDAQLRLGESVLIIGANELGLAQIQAATLCGAYPIIVADPNPERLDVTEELGATHCIDTNHCDLTEIVQEIVGPDGCDVVIENTGSTKVMQQALDCTLGRCILVGVPQWDDQLSLRTLPLQYGKEIRAVYKDSCLPHVDIPRLVRLVESGRLDIGAMITEGCDLRNINACIARMRAQKIDGRCILRCQPVTKPEPSSYRQKRLGALRRYCLAGW